MESCYTWLTFISEYLSAYFTVVVLGKFKIRVHQGVHKPFLSHFCLFTEIVCLFLQFFTLESCFLFSLSLEYPSAYIYSFALVKFKILVYLGVCKPCFEQYCPFYFFYFFNFLLWNHVRYVMLSVYELVLAPSDLLACGLLCIATRPSPLCAC